MHNLIESIVMVLFQIAVPLSPSSSTALQQPEKVIQKPHEPLLTAFSALDLNKDLRRLKSVQTCSSIDLVNTEKLENSRRTKSQEVLRKDGHESEIIRILEEVEHCSDLHDKDKMLRKELIKRFNKNSDILQKTNVEACIRCLSNNENCLKSSNELRVSQREHKFKDDIDLCSNDFLDSIIYDWIKEMPIKSKYFIGKHVDKGSVLVDIANKLKIFILNFEGTKLKAKIFEYINDILIDHHGVNKRSYLNRQIDLLLRKASFVLNRRKTNITTLNFKKYVASSITELRKYIRYEIDNSLKNSHIKINTKLLKELEITLLEALMGSTDILANSNQLRDEILNIIMKFNDFDHQQALSYANTLIKNLKNVFSEKDYIKKENTFVVQQSTCSNSSKQMNTNESSGFSISGINEEDLEANLDYYLNKLTEEIDDWLTNLGIHEEDKSFQQVVVNDLATDIVDRHKYLELNPSSQGTEEEELEHLKYQIFKWINKLVGEENTNTIDHANDLMKRIQSIPVPMLTKFGQSNNTNLPACCQKETKIPGNSGSKSGQYNQINQKPFQETFRTKNVCPGGMNIGQIPNFGPSGLSGSMIESIPRLVNPNRRHSAPDGNNTCHIIPNFENMNIRQLPLCPPNISDLTMEQSGPAYNNRNTSNMQMSGCSDSGCGMIAIPNRYNVPREFSSPGGFNVGLMNMSGQVAPLHSKGADVYGLGVVPTTNISNGECSRNFNHISMTEPGGYRIGTPKHTKTQYQRALSGPDINELRGMPLRNYGKPNATVSGGQNAGSSMSASRQPACCQGRDNTKQTTRDQKPGPSTKQISQLQGCCPAKYDSLKPTLQELDSDFDAYLKQWVKKIPISDASPDERTQMQELLINNVYKIIAIVKCNPEVLSNSVLYQDLLEEQIDALFEQLSPSSELLAKQHALKTELLEKITSIERDIKKSVLISSYRNQLLENIKNNFPGANKVYDKHDYYIEFNDLKQRGDIVDNFILQMYFSDDRAKSNVYKLRVSKGIHDMVRDITESQNLVINLDATVNSLQAALYNVPMPSEEELKLEANQILLAQEVEQWLIDLPISETDTILVAHQKRILRDGIVRKIYEIESKNIDNCRVEQELKQEVLKAVERIPMNSEDTDINFMVEELVNRLKNRPKNVPRRKSVTFHDSTINYEDFGRSGMVCSSYNENINESYNIVGGERRDLSYFPTTQPTPPQRLFPQGPIQTSQTHYNTSEFHTMEQSSFPACEMYNQIISTQIRGDKNGLYSSMRKDKPVSVQPGICQQIPCGQPMSQSQHDSMSNQSVYIPITQNPCGNISQAQQISIQPQIFEASPGLGQQINCGQPIVRMYQDEVAPHQSMHTSVASVPCGHMSRSQQDRAQLPHLGSPGRFQELRSEIPIPSLPHNQTCEIPNRNVSCSQVPHTSNVQQSISTPCGSPRQVYNEINPAPGSICGNTMQLQQPAPIINNTLHTSQMPGSSEMPSGLALQNSSPFSCGVTQSNQRAEFGQDPRFLNPSTVQGIGKQTTSEFSTDPVANSTPQRQAQSAAIPPKLAKKKPREVDKNGLEQVARRIDLETSDEDDEDDCKCIEKLLRCRKRRPIFLRCDDYDDLPGCYIKYPLHFFF